MKVIGIDAYTLDRPFANMVADYRRTGDGRFIWPAHFAGITREYCQIEKLANLDQLPRPHGFYVSCLPVKIQRRQRRLVPGRGAAPGRLSRRDAVNGRREDGETRRGVRRATGKLRRRGESFFPSLGQVLSSLLFTCSTIYSGEAAG